MAVSLVLATIQRTDDVGRLVASLIDQTSRAFELIVVDQNADDRLAPYLRLAREAGLDVRHERMQMPGLSAARNRGIERAKHSILAFPDDDCWYERDVIENVIATFGQHPVSGVVARWVEQAGGNFNTPYFLELAAWRAFRGGYASSITLFVQKSLMESVGGFDERFGVGKWYGAAEETDFILNALSSGARIAYQPQVRVHHRYAASSSAPVALRCRNARRRSRGTGALYAKHGLPWTVVFRGVVAPVFLSVFRARPAEVAPAFFTVLGRVEGFLRWKFFN